MNPDFCKYTAEMLYRHIDCLWDESYLMRVRDPHEIRAPSDPARQPDLPLEVADIRRAWRKARITTRDRQVFLLRAFWLTPLEGIAQLFELTEQEVADVLDVVVAEIVQALNGGTR